VNARVPSTGKPAFIMTGIERPGGGVRLYASRDLPGVFFGVTGQDDTAAWHVDADMRHALVIDGSSWGEVFARAFEIWGNHDRAVEVDAARRDARRELPR